MISHEQQQANIHAMEVHGDSGSGLRSCRLMFGMVLIFASRSALHCISDAGSHGYTVAVVRRATN